MIYCDKCSKILEKDVQFCPICNEEDIFWLSSPEEPVAVSQGKFRGEAFDRLREINLHIEEKSQNPEPRKQQIIEEKPSALLYAMIIFLSVFFSIGGLVLGVVYANSRNRHFRSMGFVAIVVSLIFMIFTVVFFFALLLMMRMI